MTNSTPEKSIKLGRATGQSGDTPYLVAINSGVHAFQADEPHNLGGGNAGPAPYDLLMAALVACTTITLKMYASRKAWPLTAVDVHTEILREGDSESILRKVSLKGQLDALQLKRLVEVVELTPVTKTLKRGTAIHSTVMLLPEK